MRHARISGCLLIVTAALHIGVGVARGREALTAMADDGLWLAARESVDRQLTVWFIVCGFAFLLSGILALHSVKPLPSSFGWTLAALAIAGLILLGPSGFILVVPQAIYILVIAHRQSKDADPA